MVQNGAAEKEGCRNIESETTFTKSIKKILEGVEISVRGQLDGA